MKPVGWAADFAKEHPTLTLAAAAGAGLIVGAEFALGAALGMGAAMLLSGKSGAELREEIRRRGKSLIDAGADLSSEVWHRARGVLPGGRQA